MDIAEMATRLAATLAPYLPLLTKGSETVAEAGVKLAWKHIASAFEHDAGLQGVQKLAETGTSSAIVESALAEHLERYLKAHPERVAAMASDPQVTEQIQEARAGGKLRNAKQSQRGAAAFQKQSAHGVGSEAEGLEQSAGIDDPSPKG